MSEESIAGYKHFNEIIKNIGEKTREELKKPIPDIVKHLIKRYTDLQKKLPKDFVGLTLPDYDDYLERLINLKKSRIRIYDKKTSKTIKSTTVSKYFEEILSKIEEKIKTERYQGMEVNLKYDFLDNAYRTLLMWEGYFSRIKESK
jgi:enoyl reductase-like protein